MGNIMNWKRALGFGGRTGFVLGILIGFQEGFLSTTIKSGAATNVPLSSIPKLIQVFFVPLFAEAILWMTVCGLLALILNLIFGRRFVLILEEDRFVPFFIGLATTMAIGLYIFTLFNPSFRINAMLTPAKLFFNLRLIFIVLVVGLSTGVFSAWLRRRPNAHKVKAFLVSLGLWVTIFTPVVLWVNRVYLDYEFNLLFFGVLGGLLLALCLMVWLTTLFLMWRNVRGCSRKGGRLSRYPPRS